MTRRIPQLPMDKKIPHLDVEDVISKLTLDEKVLLLSGKDFWHTNPVHRLNVPSLRTSDGPNGVRGTRFFNGVPAACLPCGTALASTWDKALVKSGGELMGHEAIAKGAHVLLGPTMNIQRSPLGGRGFESFSEDPFLAGSLGAATVAGIQSTGVAATAKHFVCNDQEHERRAVSAIVTERALREIYLMPFQITQRHSKPRCYMTAYNKVNGTSASENPKILDDILRKEWGFDGLVMSDWFGTYSAAESIRAGLDLEMPGPTKVRGELAKIALEIRKIDENLVDQRLHALLNLINYCRQNGTPENAPEKSSDTPETAKTLRDIGASTQVLLKNEKGVLPFKKDKTVAVIGPNAKMAAISGGGSASLRPYYAVTPFDGISAQANDVKYALGAEGFKGLPLISEVCKTADGKRGLIGKVYSKPPSSSDREVVEEIYTDKSDLHLVDYQNEKLGTDYWIDFEATVVPDISGDYIFGLSVAGTAKLFVDDKLAIDNATKQTAGDFFFGSGTIEERATLSFKADKPYAIRVEFGSSGTSPLTVPGVTPSGGGGLRLGMTRTVDPQAEIDAAVKLAKEVDQVVICAGLNADWESEGYDRTHMDLPGHSDALIAAVAAANPRTVVVLQSGTPVTMPWAPAVAGIVQSWFGGNETGNAIADVLFGDVNPGGKLPLSFPLTVQDNPAFLNYRSERGRVLYGEDVFVGYRFYEKLGREVRFPFGHGLSYTTFEMNGLRVSEEGGDVVVRLDVRNTGRVRGAQVVQVYVAQKGPSVARPVKELKGFEKVGLEAGERKEVEVRMEKKYAASFWDETREAWCMEKDEYEVLVGDSSESTPLRGIFQVEKTVFWKGL